MKYSIITIKGVRPTKKDPGVKKVTAKEKLAEFLAMTQNDIVAIIPSGFGMYDVVIRSNG